MDMAEQIDNEQASRWNGSAGRAWVDAQALLDRMFQPFEDMLVEAVRAKTVRQVLDVGCGTGGVTLALARQLGTGGRCVGVDISEPMVAAAQARAEREDALAGFICADAQSCIFEPASFDMIVSRFGVMFFDAPVAAFANLRRVAREDAELRFIAWRSAEENPFMTTAERAAASLLPNLPARRSNMPGQFAFADRHRISSILQESGWAEIDIQAIDVECMLSEKELIGYFTRLGLVGQALQGLDEPTRGQVLETVRVAFDSYVNDTDVRYTAACWMVGARAPFASVLKEATHG